MSAKDRGKGLGKGGEAALADLRSAALRNKYVQRLIEDEELRTNLLSAYSAARSAYGRMNNGKPASKALFEDSKLQNDLREASEALRDAATTLREPSAKPRRRRRRGPGRMLALLFVGAVLALVLSEDLRSKVLDLMFGAEDEFEYSSTTTPAEPAPAVPSAS